MDTRETTRAVQALTRAAETLHNAMGLPSTVTARPDGLGLFLSHVGGDSLEVQLWHHDGWRIVSKWTGDQYWTPLYVGNDSDRMLSYYAAHLQHIIG